MSNNKIEHNLKTVYGLYWVGSRRNLGGSLFFDDKDEAERVLAGLFPDFPSIEKRLEVQTYELGDEG